MESQEKNEAEIKQNDAQVIRTTFKMPLFYFSLLFYINGNILETQVLTSADLFPSLCTSKVGEVEPYSASTTSWSEPVVKQELSITGQQNMVPNTLKSFKIQNRAALFTNCHLPGFVLQLCVRQPASH